MLYNIIGSALTSHAKPLHAYCTVLLELRAESMTRCYPRLSHVRYW